MGLSILRGMIRFARSGSMGMGHIEIFSLTG